MHIFPVWNKRASLWFRNLPAAKCAILNGFVDFFSFNQRASPWFRVLPANKCVIINNGCGNFYFLINTLYCDLEICHPQNARLIVVIVFFIVFNKRASLRFINLPTMKCAIYWRLLIFLVLINALYCDWEFRRLIKVHY